MFTYIVTHFAVNGPEEFSLDVEDYLVGECSTYVFYFIEWNALVVCCCWVINITLELEKNERNHLFAL